MTTVRICTLPPILLVFNSKNTDWWDNTGRNRQYKMDARVLLEKIEERALWKDLDLNVRKIFNKAVRNIHVIQTNLKWPMLWLQGQHSHLGSVP